MLTPRPTGGASGGVQQGQHGVQRSRARSRMAGVSAHCRKFQSEGGLFRAGASRTCQCKISPASNGAKAGRAHDGRASLVWDRPPSRARVTNQSIFSPSSRASDEVCCLTPRLKSSANQDGWKARKTFDHRRRPPRARGSERHAESDIRKPKMACRCERV